jgi:predicted NAD/FAD-binding protein
MYKLYSYWSAPKPEDVEEPLHYRIAEMVFASPEALGKCAESDQWKTLRECSATMIERFGVSLKVEAGDEVIANLPKG